MILQKMHNKKRFYTTICQKQILVIMNLIKNSIHKQYWPYI
jgi:hypothetical protein